MATLASQIRPNRLTTSKPDFFYFKKFTQGFWKIKKREKKKIWAVGKPLICIKSQGSFCSFRAFLLVTDQTKTGNRLGGSPPLVSWNQLDNRCTFGREITKCVFCPPSISLNKRFWVLVVGWGHCGFCFLFLLNTIVKCNYVAGLHKFVQVFCCIFALHKSFFAFFRLFLLQIFCLHNLPNIGAHMPTQ